MFSRYPQEAVLRDGRRVLIEPFKQHHTDRLYEFFQRLPEDARRLAWDRIDNPALVEEWGRNIDYGKAFPLLALDGSRIVADATLHRREGGPLRLVGRIKWLIDPEFRGIGLGSLLVNHFIDTARANGLRHLSCMLLSDYEDDAIKVLKDLGFRAFEIPGYGADPDGGAHHMTHMVLEL
jgi:GNAT superfamily N-acetyltransferase